MERSPCVRQGRQAGQVAALGRQQDTAGLLNLPGPAFDSVSPQTLLVGRDDVQGPALCGNGVCGHAAQPRWEEDIACPPC